MAVMNAEMVLNAETAANDAVEDADNALQDAMAAKTAAEALADDDPDRAGAIAAAEEAIKQATAQKKMAMDLVDLAEDTDAGIQSLKGAVEVVEGDNPLADGYPKMPAGHGEDVAANVMTALAASVTSITANDAPKGAIMHDGADIGAMTWAMIVGEANVMDVLRLFAADAVTISEVKAMSVMGSMASGLAAKDDATLPKDSDAV